MESSVIYNYLITKMYSKKPNIDSTGNIIFTKSTLILISGIFLILLFSFCALFMDYYIEELVKDYNMSTKATNNLYFYGYSLTGFFILFGLIQVLIFLKHKSIFSKNKITSIKIFSKKTLLLSEVNVVEFNRKGFVFKGLDEKISFGTFTIGLFTALEFVEENIPHHKCEKAILSANKMFKKYNISYKKIYDISI